MILIRIILCSMKRAAWKISDGALGVGFLMRIVSLLAGKMMKAIDKRMNGGNNVFINSVACHIWS